MQPAVYIVEESVYPRLHIRKARRSCHRLHQYTYVGRGACVDTPIIPRLESNSVIFNGAQSVNSPNTLDQHSMPDPMLESSLPDHTGTSSVATLPMPTLAHSHPGPSTVAALTVPTVAASHPGPSTVAALTVPASHPGPSTVAGSHPGPTVVASVQFEQDEQRSIDVEECKEVELTKGVISG